MQPSPAVKMRDANTLDRLKSKSVSDNDSISKYIDNYLWLGETVMDQSVAFLGTSKYFERKR
jgi:Fungal protein of unknown function (DUF1748)